MNTHYEVVGVAITPTHLTVYLANGDTINIFQGDHRVRKIVEFVEKSDLSASGVCLVPHTLFEEPEDPEAQVYNQVSETSGLVKFFKVAKEKIKSLFGVSSENDLTPITERQIGDCRGARQLSLPLTQAEKLAEVMAHAKPLKRIPDEDSEDTVIGIANGAVIPEIHKMKNQIHHVSENPERIVGMNMFLKRLANKINGGGHTTQDVLDFVQKNNMPIADDGSIIVFKRVYKTPEQGVFVDCHSKSVKQRVGDIVRMDISQVDPDRYRECSTGLHVARWDYLRTFVGDALLICKLYPEHIIAVPHGDPSKVRASEYTIIGEITGEEYSNVLNDPLGLGLTEKGKQILANAVKGSLDPAYPGVVFISDQGAITYTPGKKKEPTKVAYSIDVKPVVEVPKTEKFKDVPIDVRKLASKVNKTKPVSRKETMQSLIELWERTRSTHDLRKIRDYKRKTKSSWKTLGVSGATEEKLTKALKYLE